MDDIFQFLGDHLNSIEAIATILVIIGTIIGTIIGVIRLIRKIKKGKSPEIEVRKVIHEHKHEHIHKHVLVSELPISDEEAKRVHQIEKVGFVREDQESSYEVIASPKDEHEKMLLQLKPYLNEIDLDILISVFSIIRAQEIGNYKQSDELHKKMKSKFGIRASRIYDLVNSNLFSERLVPFIQELSKNYGENLPLKKKLFDEYFMSFVRTTTDRIWVSQWKIMNLENEIEQKITKHRLNELLIYASGRKGGIGLVEDKCKIFMSTHKDFSLTLSEFYRIRNGFGRTFILTKIVA